MKKVVLILTMILTLCCLAGCGNNEETKITGTYYQNRDGEINDTRYLKFYDSGKCYYYATTFVSKSCEYDLSENEVLITYSYENQYDKSDNGNDTITCTLNDNELNCDKGFVDTIGWKKVTDFKKK